MRKIMTCVALVLVLGFAAAAYAGIYDDVNNAVRAHGDGDIMYAFEQYSKIIESGELKSDPKILAYIYNNRAVIWLQQGNDQKAMEDYEEALKLHPEPAAYFNRGLIKAQRGDVQSALKDYDKAIELNPEFWKAHQERGHARLALGDVVGGRSDLAEAARLIMKIEFF